MEVLCKLVSMFPIFKTLSTEFHNSEATDHFQNRARNPIELLDGTTTRAAEFGQLKTRSNSLNLIRQYVMKKSVSDGPISN